MMALDWRAKEREQVSELANEPKHVSMKWDSSDYFYCSIFLLFNLLIEKQTMAAGAEWDQLWVIKMNDEIKEAKVEKKKKKKEKESSERVQSAQEPTTTPLWYQLIWIKSFLYLYD